MVTIDANVFVSARVRSETNHAASDLFLNRVVQSATEVRCPTLVLPETAAAIFRPGGTLALARAAVLQIELFPSLSLVGLTEDRARQSVEVALTCRLRGADAVYVLVAQEFGTTLVTWDAEVLARGTAAASVLSPTEWLAANPI